MKISSSFFDQNHIKELERHTQAFNKSIHLISSKNRSISKFENVTEELLLVDDNNLIKTLNSIQGSFDLVVITDLFELTDDIYSVFKSIANVINPDGKLLINSVNPKWNAVLKIFEKLKLKTASQDRAYIHPKKIINIAKSDGYELNKYYSRQLFPFRIFGLGKIVNKILEVILLPFNVGIKNYMVFGSYKIENQIKSKSKSIIIPAKNEEKNLIPLIKRIPHFNEEYELVVVYGDSKDKTEEVVLNLENVFPELNIKVLKQSSNGKANAVWEAVEVCDMELIAILDSDQSVDPETLEHFFEILENGNADFVNGTRLIYPMEDKAMRTINTLGNKIFQFLISLVIKQKLTDSLCGTKVFKKSSLIKIKYWQNSLSSKDPFGDFDLIFSAAYAGDKILEYPVHYRARVYGETQISRFRDGFKLIKYFVESYYLFNISK
jgi:hypothetical protein